MTPYGSANRRSKESLVEFMVDLAAFLVQQRSDNVADAIQNLCGPD